MRRSEALSRLGLVGDGVYATREHEVGDVLGYYDCERISDRECERRYGDGVAVYSLEDAMTRRQRRRGVRVSYADAALDRNIFSLINDAHGLGDDVKNNVEFDYVDGETAMGVVAKRKLKVGDELLVSYGSDYWKQFAEKQTYYVTERV